MKIASTPLGDDITRNLNFSQTTTYLYIINQIIDHKSLTKSNKNIAKDLNISISTLEKHLRVLDKQGLIDRSNCRARNPITLNWETVSREISIPDEVIDPRVLSQMHIQRIHNLLDLVVTPEHTKMMIKNAKESRAKLETR